MTQAELDCEVAKLTGESTGTIAHIGFLHLTRRPAEVGREPLTIDWDEQIERRYKLLPH
jgi:hypothetical protein